MRIRPSSLASRFSMLIFRNIVVLMFLLLMAVLGMVPGVAGASFGIEPGSFKVSALNADGSIDTQAGSHPYSYTVSFGFNRNGAGEPEGEARDVELYLPPGLVGDPLALSRCPRVDFEPVEPLCPGDSQLGVLQANVVGVGESRPPVYDAMPAQGEPARFGTALDGFNSLFDTALRTNENYRVAVLAHNIPVRLFSAAAVVWGVPADHAHDPERTCLPLRPGSEVFIHGCVSGAAPRPFLTLPTSCTGGPLQTTIRTDSQQEPGVYREAHALSLDTGGNPVGLTGCGRLPFEPSITALPETTMADSPTGLDVDLHVPQNEEPEGLATANLKRTVVTLPAGFSVDPSQADGLAACTPGQIGFEGFREGREAYSGVPAQCPNASELGTVEVLTPLVEHPLPGKVYLAVQRDNPFGSLLAIYITVNDPETGVVVKLAGHVEMGGQPGVTGLATGQIRTTVAESPELPFEDFRLHFFGGPRGVLTTPATCGRYTTVTDLTPWTSPFEPDATPASPFTINTSPTGGACVHSEGEEPARPSFKAGTVTQFAGSYSPFVLRLSREDGTAPFGALNMTLPEGLTGKLAGIQQCPPQAIEQARSREHEGGGDEERTDPSCPPGSEVGTVTVGAGSGTPFQVQGHAYLTGPYKGAPFGLAIITPAIAGPFDLGTVLVRAAIYIDPHSARVTVKSDPIPQSLDGIPLDIRSIAVNINHPAFTLNPTSCEQQTITGETISPQGQNTPLSDSFQTVGCQDLPFKPTLSVSTSGKTSKANGASLLVTYAAATAGQANTAKVKVSFPEQLPARLTTLQKSCTEQQFATNPAGCPSASIIGTAIARTPLLASPLTGPVYLVSHGGRAFPDVVFMLQGEGVQIIQTAGTNIKKGITTSTFENVPDAPFTIQATFPQASNSILAANGNLCKPTKTITTKKHVTIHTHNGHKKTITRTIKQTIPAPLTMPTTITAQNGTTINQNTKITVTNCPTKHTTHHNKQHNKKK